MQYKNNESGKHIRGKDILKDLLLKDNDNIRDIRLEVRRGNRIPDLSLILNADQKIAVEYQNSRSNSKKIIPRTKDLNKNGFYVLWVQNGRTYGKLPKNSEDIMVYSEERELHKLNRGRVYYLNISEMGLESMLYELHFERNYGKKNSLKKIAFIKIKMSEIVADLKEKFGTQLPYNLLRFEKKWLKNTESRNCWNGSYIKRFNSIYFFKERFFFCIREYKSIYFIITFLRYLKTSFIISIPPNF